MWRVVLLPSFVHTFLGAHPRICGRMGGHSAPSKVKEANKGMH